MDDKQTILNRIYKECFCHEDIREAFQREWKYIYDTLMEDADEILSQEVLHYVDLWMDAM